MKNDKTEKKAKFATVIAVCAVGLVAFIMLQTVTLLAARPAVQTERFSRRIKLVLYEGGTDQLLQNVQVVIPETGERFMVNSGDYLLVEKELAEVTLLLFKEGYCDTAVFHLPLAAGKLKTVRYALFVDDGSMPFTVYCEAPEDSTVKNLLAAWKKK